MILRCGGREKEHRCVLFFFLNNAQMQKGELVWFTENGGKGVIESNIWLVLYTIYSFLDKKSRDGEEVKESNQCIFIVRYH